MQELRRTKFIGEKTILLISTQIDDHKVMIPGQVGLNRDGTVESYLMMMMMMHRGVKPNNLQDFEAESLTC